jgi:hypothetical protein
LIEMLVAHTAEPDEPDRAVADILSQLDLGGGRLRRHSAAIVHCNNEFMESGALKAVCDCLPFPSVGVNTVLSSTSGGVTDVMLLTLSVLTSDDCRFVAGLSEPVTDDVRVPVARLYIEAENLLDSRPAMGIIFACLHPRLPLGEMLVETLDEVSDGVPFFGALAADYTTAPRTPRILFNGEFYQDRAAALLIEGPVEPHFHVHTVSLAHSIRQKAVITNSVDNVILQVNGMPVLDFMESLGLCRDGQIAGVHTIPLSIDLSDGSPPVFRNIFAQTREGGIIIGGRAPAGALLGIGAMDIDHILEGTRSLSARAGFRADRPLLIYSCLSRNIVLGFRYTFEADSIRESLERRLPYFFAYSMGEICPVPARGGRWRNAYHNMALVAASV